MFTYDYGLTTQKGLIGLSQMAPNMEELKTLLTYQISGVLSRTNTPQGIYEFRGYLSNGDSFHSKSFGGLAVWDGKIIQTNFNEKIKEE